MYCAPQDEALATVLQQNRGLRRVALAGCSSITDRALLVSHIYPNRSTLNPVLQPVALAGCSSITDRALLVSHTGS